MAEVTQDQFVDYIKNISVLELSQLVKKLEAELGVSAAAAVPMASGGFPMHSLTRPQPPVITPGPLAGPVGDGADRAAVVDEAREHVMRVLPHRFGDDDRRMRVHARAEDLQAFPLRLDEPVFLVFLVGMRADEFIAGSTDGLGELLFHRLLRGPADLVGAEP